MSCHICGSYYGCNCGSSCITENIQDCEHEDPGLETSGAHLPIYDYLFNQRRLTNVVGILTNEQTGGGSGHSIMFRLDPQVLHTGLNLPLNTTFTGLLAATGSTGNYRRLLPTAAGFLQGNADGTWQLVAAPTAVIPDPLVVTTFSANDGTFVNLTVTGLPIFSGLANDTIVSNIGLNASDELVIGSVAQGSVAKFQENVVETDGGRPNQGLVAGSYVRFTNEISDVDGLAHPINFEELEIDVAGTYLVRWGVGFGPHTGQNNTQEWQPRLALEHNGGIVSYGDNPDGKYSKNSSLTATGMWIGTLNIADSFRLLISNAVSGDGMPVNGTGTESGVSGANMILNRIK